MADERGERGTPAWAGMLDARVSIRDIPELLERAGVLTWSPLRNAWIEHHGVIESEDLAKLLCDVFREKLNQVAEGERWEPVEDTGAVHHAPLKDFVEFGYRAGREHAAEELGRAGWKGPQSDKPGGVRDGRQESKWELSSIIEEMRQIGKRLQEIWKYIDSQPVLLDDATIREEVLRDEKLYNVDPRLLGVAEKAESGKVRDDGARAAAEMEAGRRFGKSIFRPAGQTAEERAGYQNSEGLYLYGASDEMNIPLRNVTATHYSGKHADIFQPSSLSPKHEKMIVMLSDEEGDYLRIEGLAGRIQELRNRATVLETREFLNIVAGEIQKNRSERAPQTSGLALKLLRDEAFQKHTGPHEIQTLKIQAPAPLIQAIRELLQLKAEGEDGDPSEELGKIIYRQRYRYGVLEGKPGRPSLPDEEVLAHEQRHDNTMIRMGDVEFIIHKGMDAVGLKPDDVIKGDELQERLYSGFDLRQDELEAPGNEEEE